MIASFFIKRAELPLGTYLTRRAAGTYGNAGTGPHQFLAGKLRKPIAITNQRGNFRQHQHFWYSGAPAYKSCTISIVLY